MGEGLGQCLRDGVELIERPSVTTLGLPRVSPIRARMAIILAQATGHELDRDLLNSRAFGKHKVLRITSILFSSKGAIRRTSPESYN
jgi:hypothetical protein